MRAATVDFGCSIAKVLLRPMLQQRLESRAEEHAARAAHEAGLLIIQAEVIEPFSQDLLDIRKGRG